MSHTLGEQLSAMADANELKVIDAIFEGLEERLVQEAQQGSRSLRLWSPTRDEYKRHKKLVAERVAKLGVRSKWRNDLFVGWALYIVW